MSNLGLKYKSKISFSQARDKITAYGIWGEHAILPRPKNRSEVANLLRAHGLDPDKITEECRECTRPVPLFEQHRLNSWTVTTYKGGTAKVANRANDEPIAIFKEPGVVSLSTYLAKFESACTIRDRSVKESSYQDFLLSVVNGIASIEAYLNEAAEYWNRNNPKDQLLDSKNSKVSLDDKFNIWLPRMTGGASLVKNDQRWSDFVILRRVRDNVAVHPKESSQCISYEELLKLINSFRLGIGGMLGQMHLAFREFVPSIVINAFYMPDVEVGK